MPLLPVAFDIPPFIQEGLANGSFIRYGGVVRDQAGQIVQHLTEVEMITNEGAGIAKRAFSFVKKNKWAIGVALVAAGGIAWAVSKNRKNQSVRVPKCLVDFDAAFQRYIVSAKDGTINQKIIEDVLVSLEEIRKNQETGKMSIEFSVENARLVIDMVREYTEKLAVANSAEIPTDISESGNAIIDLQQYVERQKDICITSA